MPKQPAIPGLRDAMKKKVTRREHFLAEMDAVVPWVRLSALIEPHYPKAGPEGGRPPMSIETMLRVYFLQNWYALSDPMAEETLYDSEANRHLADQGIPPIGTFHDAGGYYGTLAHELTHWTGAASRLDRFGRFADRKSYAFEELVAELGNCLFCATLGLTSDFEHSGAYVQGWLRAMKEDTKAIFRAASEAQKATDLILSPGRPAQQVAAE